MRWGLARHRGSTQTVKLSSVLAAPLPHILFFPRADVAGRDVEGRSKNARSQSLHREEIKSGRTLKDGAMKIKSLNYMKSAEFKARQFWLPFTDACGIALQVLANVKEQAADWFKAWVKGFRTARENKQPVQLAINFLQQRSITEWAEWQPEKNLQLFN